MNSRRSTGRQQRLQALAFALGACGLGLVLVLVPTARGAASTGGAILYGGRVLCPLDPHDASACEGKRAYNGAIFVIPRIGASSRPITTRRFDDAQPVWSPDRRRIAFVRSRSLTTGYQIWVMNADGSKARQLTYGRVDVEPDWSPDGRWLAYRSDGEIYVIRPDGSGRRKLTRNSEGVNGAGDPSWSADGRRIAFHRSARPIGTGIYSIGVDGRGLKRLARDGYEPDWSPDGRRIAFVFRTPGMIGWQVYTMGVNGGGKRQVTRGVNDVTPRWSPNSRRIAFVRNEQLAVMNADGSGIKQLTRRRGGFAIDGVGW